MAKLVQRYTSCKLLEDLGNIPFINMIYQIIKILSNFPFLSRLFYVT